MRKVNKLSAFSFNRKNPMGKICKVVQLKANSGTQQQADEGLTSEYSCCSFNFIYESWALQEYCLSLAIFCASRDLWTLFEDRRWLNHASPGFTERFVWDYSFISKSKMVFFYIKFMVLNHGVMRSNQVASIILKYCGFSLLLFSRSAPKSQELLPAFPHFQLYCSNFAIPVRTFILGSFELPKIKLEMLCWYQSPLRSVTSEMRFVLFEGRKNLVFTTSIHCKSKTSKTSGQITQHCCRNASVMNQILLMLKQFCLWLFFPSCLTSFTAEPSGRGVVCACTVCS